MTEEIKQKIEDYARSITHSSNLGNHICVAAEYGYQLASEQLTAAEARIKELEQTVAELSKAVSQAIQKGLDKQTNY